MRLFKVLNEEKNIVPFLSIEDFHDYEKSVIFSPDYSMNNGRLPLYSLENIFKTFEKAGFVNFGNSREYFSLYNYGGLSFGTYLFKEIPEAAYLGKTQEEKIPFHLHQNCIDIWANAIMHKSFNPISVEDYLRRFKNAETEEFLNESVICKFADAEKKNNWKSIFSELTGDLKNLDLMSLYGDMLAVSYGGRVYNASIDGFFDEDKKETDFFISVDGLFRKSNFLEFDQVFIKKVIYE